MKKIRHRFATAIVMFLVCCFRLALSAQDQNKETAEAKVVVTGPPAPRDAACSTGFDH